MPKATQRAEDDAQQIIVCIVNPPMTTPTPPTRRRNDQHERQSHVPEQALVFLALHLECLLLMGSPAASEAALRGGLRSALARFGLSGSAGSPLRS